MSLHAQDCVLLVVDMQAKLLPAIDDANALLKRACRLARGARELGVPVIATEHWAEKIGPTAPAMATLLDHVMHKTHFDACREHSIAQALPEGRTKVLLIGTEAHVCVLQTGLGLAHMGYMPILVSDCIGSRRPPDKAAALERWAGRGLEAVTLEMALFEWLETPAHPAFRTVLSLIKGEQP